jgi:hypothetical protein
MMPSHRDEQPDYPTSPSSGCTPIVWVQARPFNNALFVLTLPSSFSLFLHFLPSSLCYSSSLVSPAVLNWLVVTLSIIRQNPNVGNHLQSAGLQYLAPLKLAMRGLRLPPSNNDHTAISHTILVDCKSAVGIRRQHWRERKKLVLLCILALFVVVANHCEWTLIFVHLRGLS